jgi:hypothetical protein
VRRRDGPCGRRNPDTPRRSLRPSCSDGPARAQSSVVGVALLLAITAVSLALLTASVGVAVSDGVASADVSRVVDGLREATDPVVAGPTRTRLSFTGGRLQTVPRTVRVLGPDGAVASREASALVFTTGQRRVAALAGGLIRGTTTNAYFEVAPRLTVGQETAVVGLPVLNVSGPRAVAGGSPTPVELRTNVSQTRLEFDTGAYRVAVETSTPAAWERQFRARGLDPTRTDFDGDGVPSVVGAFAGEKRLLLVVYDLQMEVGRG